MQSTNQQDSAIIINPHQIALVAGGLVLLVATGHVAAHLMSFLFGIKSTPLVGLYEFLNMGIEANLPTYLSALNLLLAGSLCLIIAHYESKRRKHPDWHWWGLAVGFLVMSFDEAAQIHEGILGRFLVEAFGRGEGVMYYTWYRVYIPLVLILVFLYIPFLKRLPVRYSARFILSGLVFLSGSLGVEILESYLASQAYSTAISILFEETLEMLGIVLLIHTLLLYLAEANYTLKLIFDIDKHKGS